MIQVNAKVALDNARPALGKLKRALGKENLVRAIGTQVSRLVKDHIGELPPNKNNWPSTRFWDGCARGVDWEPTEEGLKVTVDNESKPGAFRHLFYGGVINKKDKMLTIPARAEFYGHRAGEFTNLVFARLGKSKALVVGTGGVGKVDFGTGRERNVSGAGIRSAGMVAYWLVDSVNIKAHPDILPGQDAIVGTAIQAVKDLVGGATP